MMTTTTIDKAGRVVVPKPIRDALRLDPGDTVEIDLAGGEMTLRPAPAEAMLVKEMGIWVYGSGTPVSADDVRALIDGVRDERIADLSR